MRRLLITALLAATGCQAGAPAMPGPSLSPAPSAVPSVAPALLTGAFLFYEDFEKGGDRWTLDGPRGPVGWRLLEAFACGGRYTMFVGQADQAPFGSAPGAYTLTLAAPLDLSKAVRPHLRYDLKGFATPSSACVLTAEIRAPDGDWQPVGTPVEAAMVLANTFAADLTAYAGQHVDLRFKAVLAATEAPFKGLFLDDVQVIEPAVM